MIPINLTHFAPDRPPQPAFFSYCVTPDRPVAARKQMLHAGIAAYVKWEWILVRLVASFSLLFTTFGDVLCLNFGGV